MPLPSKNLEYNVLGSCVKPIEVRNKYTGDTIIVPCGKCEACRLRKGNSYATQLAYEEANHRYTYFVTLTYHDLCIPQMSIVLDRDKPGYYCRIYDSVDDTYLFSYDFKHAETLTHLLSVTSSKDEKGFPRLTYLKTSDLQNFLKRFRKHASTISNTPVRYFAVGEYGPTHYRCHWHIILFIDDPAQATQIEELICKSWKFGRFDYSLSRGKCNTYLASYVNSLAALPDIYQTKCIRSRSYHSFGLGAYYFREHKKEIYEHGLDYFNTQVFSIGGKNSYLTVFPRIKYLLFPKCVGYGSQTTNERLRMYLTYSEFTALYGDRERPHEFLASLCIYGSYGSFIRTPEQTDFVEFLLRFCPTERKYWDFEYLKSFFYRIFYTSRHFINFCCDGFAFKGRQVLAVIEKYYTDVEERNLNNWYSAIEEYSSIYGTCLDVFYTTDLDLELFNDEDGYGFHNPIYQRLIFNLHRNFERSIKTKKVNDQFNIF